MADPVWELGPKELLTKLCESERAKALDVKDNLDAFKALHSSLSRDGGLNVDRLLSVAAKHGIKATRDEINAIFAKYDANHNSDLELKEFAAWWGTATDGLSVLLRNALSEAILVPGEVEQWKRGNCLRLDVTAGKVDDAFEAKSGIYLTVVPSSEANLKELAAGGGSGGGAGAADAGGKVPQAVVSAKLAVKDGASDEEVQQLIDLVNVVVDELTQANPAGVPARLSLSKGFENGRRVLVVQATVLNAPKDPSKMVSHVAALAGLKDQALFRRVLLGVEFGTAGSHVFAPMPAGAIAELFENFRVTAQFEYDDALLKMLTVLALQPDGLDEDSFPKLMAVAFLARGARSVHAAASFRSYKEVLAALVDKVSRIPFAKRPAKDAKELYEQAMAAAILRMRLEAVTSIAHVRSTVFNAIPALETVYGECPEPVMVQVIGAESAPKAAFIKALGGTPNGPYFNKMRVHFSKPAGKQHIMFIENDGMMCSMATDRVVAVLDASTEETLAASLRAVSVHVTNSDDLSPSKLTIVVASGSGGAGVPFAEVRSTVMAILELDDADAEKQILHFDGSSAPAGIKDKLEEGLEDVEDAPAGAGDGEDGGDGDDEDGPSMAAIAKKAFKGASKCIAGLLDVEVTNSLASVHLVMDNLPIGDVLAETDPEKIRRNRMEFQLRFGSIMEFGGGLADISELANSWNVPGEDEDGGAGAPPPPAAKREQQKRRCEGEEEAIERRNSSTPGSESD